MCNLVSAAILRLYAGAFCETGTDAKRPLKMLIARTGIQKIEDKLTVR